MLKREVILPEEQPRAEIMPRPPEPVAELPVWVEVSFFSLCMFLIITAAHWLVFG